MAPCYWFGMAIQRSDADRADGGRAGHADGLGALGQDGSIVWWSGRGWCSLLVTGWGSRAIARGGRMRAGAWSAVGGCGSPRSASPDWRMRRARASRRPTARTAARRILALLDRPPPEGLARWTAPLLAGELGDVTISTSGAFCARARSISPARKSWCPSDDPEFVAKAAESSASTSTRPSMPSSGGR